MFRHVDEYAFLIQNNPSTLIDCKRLGPKGSAVVRDEDAGMRIQLMNALYVFRQTSRYSQTLYLRIINRRIHGGKRRQGPRQDPVELGDGHAVVGARHTGGARPFPGGPGSPAG